MQSLVSSLMKAAVLSGGSGGKRQRERALPLRGRLQCRCRRRGRRREQRQYRPRGGVQAAGQRAQRAAGARCALGHSKCHTTLAGCR